MRKRLLTIALLSVFCLLLTACGYPADGPKVEAGDYLQQVLLYDSAGTLTADEIFSRYWRIGEDGSLQYKIETEAEFVNCGVGKTHRITEEKLIAQFTKPELMTAALPVLADFTDGLLFTQADHDILLLRTAAGATLLATLGEIEGQRQVTTLFQLDAGEIPPTTVPLEYTWDPYAVSDIYSNIFGHRFESDFRSMVGAILRGETTFYCSDYSNATRLHNYADACFPPYSKIVANMFFDEGMAHIIYKLYGDERQAVLDEFYRNINYLVSSALKEGDTPTTMAIALYNAYSYQITYDYEAKADDKNLTTYRAMTEYTGIAKNFATAYAYLCTQMNINAVPVGGLSALNFAHDWTLLQIDGRYYYADPAWETQKGGTGLRYFGLSTQQRYDDDYFLAHYTNIANSNSLWGNNIDVSDEKFRPLQEIVDIQQMWRIDGVLHIRGTNAAGETLQVTAE